MGLRSLLGVADVKRLMKMKPKFSRLQRHDGTMGQLTISTLLHEAEWACKFLVQADKSMMAHDWKNAIDSYFKSAAVATNIIFTANIHQIPIPEKCVADMNAIIARSTEGMKKIMKVAAAKALVHHEKAFHPRSRKPGAAAFMKKLLEKKR